MKRIPLRAAAITFASALLFVSLCACAADGDGDSDLSATDLSAGTGIVFPEITEEDKQQTIDTAGATQIVFSSEAATVTGGGATASSTTVTIRQAGVYVLSGAAPDGQLVVDAGDDDTVKLVLQNVTLQSADSAAIFVKNAGKTILNAAENTENFLADGASYTGQTDGEPDSTVYSKDDLTINGTGTITIAANYNDAVKSNDTLIITGAQLQIDSVDDGIVGKDFLLVSGGTIQITADGDGMKTTYDTDTSRGAICISGGTFSITAGADGIQTDVELRITDGDFTVTTGGGSANAQSAAQTDAFPGNFGRDAADSAESTTESTGSYKGLKCGQLITIEGGAFTLDTADDAIHSNSTIVLQNGSFSIQTGDDAVHADAALHINGGEITVTSCYEGLEAAEIYITGGEMHITASDDGINAAGGNDSSQQNGPMGGDPFSASTGYVEISSGYIVIDAEGDGLDSNGDVLMRGGTVLIHGPVSSGNGALDYASTFTMEGGTLIAAGAVGMAQTVSGTGAVCAVSVNTAGAAGTAVRITDADGEEVLAFAPQKSFSNVVIASDTLQAGQTYTVSTAQYTGDTQDGVLSNASYTSETTLGTFTASTTCQSVGTGGGQGNMQPGGQGGMQQPGGQGGMGGRR